MKFDEVFAGSNILVHPALRLGLMDTDVCHNFTIRIKNFPQIAEAYGPEAVRVAQISLLARVQQALPAGGIVSPEDDGMFDVVAWANPTSSALHPTLGCGDWLNTLLSHVLLEPVITGAGPIHLDVELVRQEQEGPHGAGSSCSPLALWEDGKDIDYARHAYRADMALLSPVLAALGRFGSEGEHGLGVDVFWVPVCDATSSELTVFYEAALRLINAKGQCTIAEREIAAAERLGFVRLLDQFVVSRAVDGLIDGHGEACFLVSVSEQSLMDSQFWSNAIGKLNIGGGIASDLIVEVRGSRICGASSSVLDALGELRRQGCRTSIGNFGLGATSLREITAIRPDFVTIDKKLLSPAALARFGFAALTHLVEFAKALGCRVVVDGVDSAEQASASRDLGASLFKGEWCGRPRIYRSWVHQTSLEGRHLQGPHT